jgi:FG-GAP repeat
MFARTVEPSLAFPTQGGRAALGLFCLIGLAFGDPAVAQIASPVANISPVNSDRDNSNPKSASGGRANKLAAHPSNDQIYFAASEWGGLYRTSDRGRNWSHVPGHVPQVTWDVEFDPSDPSVLIATSFFDGKVVSRSGINVSRDGGQTWAVPATARPALADCAITAAAAEPAAFGIAFDRDDPENVYVGTNCGLAISTDGGTTWDFIDPTPGDGGGLNVYDVIVHDNGIIDICGDDGHQRSTDGGATFAAGAAEVGGQCTVAVSPDEDDVLFMSVSTQIFESRDAGATWPTSFVNPGAQGRIPFVKVNDRSGTAFDLWYGDTQLFRAGCTTPANTGSDTQRCPASSAWSNAQNGGHWDVGDLAFDPNDGQNACPVIFSNDGGVYFNQRSGSDCHDPRWEQPQRSVTALWLWDMDGNTRVTPGEEGVYMGQQDSGAFGTRQAPASAPDWNSPACCDVFDVEAEDNRVVYTVCCFLGGGRFTRMFLDDDSMDGGPEVPNYPTGNLVTFRDTDSLSNYAPNSYAVVTSGGVFFTTNIAAGTITWQQLGTAAPAGICGIYSSRRNDGTPVFTARAGGCSLGQTGALWQHVGATTTGNWVRIDRNGVSQFGAFGVNPRNPNHIIASDRSGPSPVMVRTFDGGASWSALPQLDTMLTGNGDFLAQTQMGARPGDIGYPQASLVAINPADGDMIVAAGQDSGVFLSLDGGNSWHLMTDPRTNNALRPHLSRPLFAHFESFFNGHANVYIGARGRGAWRVTINRATFVTASDFDGDGTGDVAIGSPWGIGTLEKSGGSFTALALKPNGSRFDGWLLNTNDNRLEIVADLNGDGKSEMVFASPWGIGLLRLAGTTYGAYMLRPNGTRFGGWLLNTADNKFGPAGDFDGDGKDEFLVTSPWGIGVFEFDGTTFTVPVMAPNGTRFGGWLLNTADNKFGPVGDFDADGKDEVMVSSPWGIGVFNIDGGTISTPALKPNGTRFDGWLLNTADNRFGPVGDFDADGKDDIVVRSPWGIGILDLSGNTFAGLMLKPNGTNFGGWVLDTASNHSWAAGNFVHSSRDDLFVSGLSGVAILKFDKPARTFGATVVGNNGARFGGWLLNTQDNRFDGFRDLTGNDRAHILVSSPWGIGLLSQSGSTFSLPVIAQNGTRFGGWLLNTADNKFW